MMMKHIVLHLIPEDVVVFKSIYIIKKRDQVKPDPVGNFLDSAENCKPAEFSFHLFRLADEAVCLKECVDCNCNETEHEKSYDDVTDHVQSLFPDLVAPTDGLES